MRHIIISGFFLLALLSLSVFIFDPTHLYFEIPWLDIPMHILGGFGVASFVMSVATYGKQKLSFTQVFIVYLCVAITWELYEFAHDLLRGTAWTGWPDTIKDLFDGAVGATTAFFLLKK
jgi:hypothetical protein